ncbi:MAG: hypothetical protein Q9166_002254 [cf. Caloplaca sp. 2 TL-2023]
MAAAPAEIYWVTTILVKNIHCGSCISIIKHALSFFGPAVFPPKVSLLSQTVEVRHRSSLPVRELCAELAHAAFDVVSASTDDESGRRVRDVEFTIQDDWLEAALERCNSPRKTKIMGRSYSSTATTMLDRKARHEQYCQTCAMESVTETMLWDFAKQHQKQDDDKGFEKAVPQDTRDDHDTNYTCDTITRSIEQANARVDYTPTRYALTLLIVGMTCASCANGITAAIREQEYVLNAEVSLLTNSAVVEFTGSEEKAGAIVDLVEDMGFDASIGALKPLIRKTAKEVTNNLGLIPRRSIMLKIDGMFCDHCSSRAVEALTHQYPGQIDIENPPALKNPIIRLGYTPNPGLLTIRDIISTINEVHPHFDTHVFHPPSVEDQSQSMQAHERRKLLLRLIVCSVISIPTLLIGVIWMSLVPPTNSMRKFFEKADWGGGMATRAQWALFILATPIMIFAADVFHIRAMKEIRALWRRKSQIPILRRFYRFGSMSLLVSAGTSVAYFSSLGLLIQSAKTKSGTLGHSTQYFDAVVFLTFFILLGKFLEAYSKAKTGSAVMMLGKLRPQKALLVNPAVSSDFPPKSTRQSLSIKDQDVSTSSTSSTQKISVDLLEIGDIVVVPCGSSPPADGIVVSGSSRFNESSLTGESRDVPKSEGDQVFTGTVNTGNPVHVEITDLGGTSMLDQIISVVREGQTKRAPVERVVDTVTGYFVPVITALAIITFVVWFALGQSGSLNQNYLDKSQGGWAFWSLEFAIAVFVVACPCGIGLAAPTALFVGGGLAAKSGILVRGGGEAFQEASNVDVVGFDKTGTLTEGGNPTVTDHQMLAEGEKSKIAWSITRSIEETSSHPLGRAIFNLASTQTLAELTSVSITEEPGRGLRGTFTTDANNVKSGDYEAAIGSEAFVSSLQDGLVNYYHSTMLSTWKSQSKSIALLALRRLPDPSTPSTADPEGWELAVIFAISDPLRPSAFSTVSALQARGIAVYMLTGDNPTTASAVASTLAIPADHVFASCLPTDKAEKIEWLKENAPLRYPSSRNLFTRMLSLGTKNNKQHEKKRRAVIAFIGDGINDAPALASANVSIAISSSTNNTSDIAVSTSSFILLSPSLTTFLILLNLSRLVFRRIKFNFFWAMGYNAILVPVAAGVFFRAKEGGFRLSPAWGSAAMAGSSISVVMASLVMGWGWKRRVRGWEKGWMKGEGA